MLDVICRLGASERRPLALICDLGEKTLDDHIARLVHVGYLRKRSLGVNRMLVPTRKGWLASHRMPYRATEWFLRHSAEVSWAVAWVSTESFSATMKQALEVEVPEAREWYSETEMAMMGPPWGPDRGPDRIRRAASVATADVGVRFGERWILIEVELSQKGGHRIQRRFEYWNDEWCRSRLDELDLVGVVYVCGNERVNNAVWSAWEDRHRFAHVRAIPEIGYSGRDPFKLCLVDLAEMRERVREIWERRRRPGGQAVAMTSSTPSSDVET